MATSLSNSSVTVQQKLPLRSPELVMDINRLGSMHQSRLSFMRHLMRVIMREQWQISPSIVDLDEDGYGTMVYTITTPNKVYSHVLFSDY